MRPRTDRADLEKYHEDLIVCSACIAGEVPRKILNGDIEGAREACEWYHRVFGDDYYLELQRHEVTDPSVLANREAFPMQQRANKVLIEMSKGVWHQVGLYQRLPLRGQGDSRGSRPSALSGNGQGP